MYGVDELIHEGAIKEEDEDGDLLVPQPPRLPLTFVHIKATGCIFWTAGILSFYISPGDCISSLLRGYSACWWMKLGTNFPIWRIRNLTN